MRFVNLDGSGPNPMRDVLRWAVLDRVRGKRPRPADGPAAPVIEVDPRIATAPAPGQPARLTWLGHASFLLQLDGLSLLLDPVFSERIARVVARKARLPLSPAALPRIDATLVSHTHYDHLDLPSLRTRVVGGTGLSRDVRRLPVEELGWWQEARLSEHVRVTFVPSQHWSRRGLFDTNESLWGGFVVQGSTAAVYHSGDTAYFGGFREIGARFPGIDAACLPIGAYDPGWFMERQHMNPEQAVQAFVDLGARTFVAMHWGTFRLTDETLQEPPARLRADWQRRGLDPARLRIPAIGETIELRESRAP